MKIYKGKREGGENVVTVDSQLLVMKRHSSDPKTIPFAWGERSPGAERLALSILCDCTDDGHAMLLAREFADEVVSKLKPEWEITADDVEQWRNFTCLIGYSAQQAAWRPYGSGFSETPAAVIHFPADFPRLLGNPNYRLSRANPNQHPVDGHATGV